jgi:hypothetical protein
MRSAASCGHPLQVIVAPRGALTWRLIVLIVLQVRDRFGLSRSWLHVTREAIDCRLSR